MTPSDMVSTEELTELERLADPVLLANDCGITPDPWQVQALRSTALRLLLLCSRQAGKTTITALIALHMALYRPGSTILLLSPSQRQSGEVFRTHVLRYYQRLTGTVPALSQTQLTIDFASGSRIISLPADPDTIRGYNSDLIIIDEASRVPDALVAAVRPMLAVTHGRLIMLSTPAGKRGAFYEAWIGSENWQRIETRAEDCPRITKEFLDEERRAMGDRFWRQEYCCSFEDLTDAVFSYAEIAAAFVDDLEPLFA